MSEPKFTPGEWKAIKGISENDDMRCGVSVSRDGIDYLIATIENGAPGDFCETEEANANIMATGPAMYAALIEAEHGLATSYQVCDYPANGRSAQDDALRTVRAALAKARGE